MTLELTTSPKLALPATASAPLRQFMQTHLALPARKASPSLGLLLGAATGAIATSTETEQAVFATRLSMAMNGVQPAEALHTPQLSGLRKAAPEELSAALTQLFAITNSRFNFAAHKKLNVVQIGFLVGTLLTSYWQFKFDEVVYVLREGIAGRLDTFDHLDEAVVMGWFRQYEAEERENLLAKHAHALRAPNPTAQPIPLDQAGAMYVRAHCSKLDPAALPAYRQQLADRFPDQPALLEAVDDYTASLWRKAEQQAHRQQQQREKVRQMLADHDTTRWLTPGEREFAQLPSLAQLQDITNTGAEEQAA